LNNLILNASDDVIFVFWLSYLWKLGLLFNLIDLVMFNLIDLVMFNLIDLVMFSLGLVILSFLDFHILLSCMRYQRFFIILPSWRVLKEIELFLIMLCLQFNDSMNFMLLLLLFWALLGVWNIINNIFRLRLIKFLRNMKYLRN